MGELYLVPKGDARFFLNQGAYRQYKLEEEELMKVPLRLEFDWKYFLQMLFGRSAK